MSRMEDIQKKMVDAGKGQEHLRNYSEYNRSHDLRPRIEY